VLGLVVGRWWALVAAIGVAVWIIVASEVEVSRWFLGPAYGAVTAAGICAGVLLRRFASRAAGPS
jgi:hypothetical protein